MGPFKIPKSRCTAAGIEAFLNRQKDQNSALNPAPELILVNNGRRDALLLAIARLVSRLELLHPFHDGNGRTFVNILLNFLLMQNGFPPATFFEPNIFDLYSENDLVDAIKDGMAHTLFIINHPDEKLYSYKPANLTTELQSKLAPINELLNAHELSTNLNETSLQAYETYLQTTWQGEQDLFRACVVGDLSTIQQLVEKEPSLLKKYAPNNMTPLYKGLSIFHLACKLNQEEIARSLYQQDATLVNLVDDHGQTPLYYAITTKNISLVQFLVEKNAEDTLLCHSARFGSLDIFKLIETTLINETKEPISHDIYFASLILAINGNNTNIIDWLLTENKVSPKKIFDAIHCGHTYNPLALALYRRNHALFNTLWCLVLEGKKVIFDDMTELLKVAAKKNELSMFKYIYSQIDPKSKINSIDYEIFALILNNGESGTAFFEYLLEVEPNLSDVKEMLEHLTLAHLAVAYNRIDILQKLLEKGFDFNQADINGQTPLHHAIVHDSAALIDFLCQKAGAIIDARSIDPTQQMLSYMSWFSKPKPNQGDTALMLAIKYEKLNAIEALLKNGATITADAQKLKVIPPSYPTPLNNQV